MLKIIFLILVVSINLLQAKEANKLKFGTGLSFISVPEYIGSSSQKQYILPYPYVYYKSDDLTIENNELFSHIYNKKDFFIDISLSGTLPVKNDSSSLRYNMKQLDPTLEIGPNFIYNLLYFNNETSYLSIKLPIRVIFSINFPNINHKGYITNPNLYLKYYFYKSVKIEISTGPTYATKEYHNYFYQVMPSDATIDRVRYNSKNGFGGWKTTTGFSYEKDNMRYGAFIKYYNLKNAVFLDSPLVNTNNSLFYGMFISYIF